MSPPDLRNLQFAYLFTIAGGRMTTGASSMSRREAEEYVALA